MKRTLTTLFSLLLLCLSQLPLPAQPQTRTVSGKVTGEDDIGMAGVTVQLKDSQAYAVTDGQGAYKIAVPAGTQTLVFTFISYKTEIIEVPAGQSLLDVMMQPEATVLEELVVVGYGVQKKESSVASITQLKGEALENVPTANLTTALTGQVAGLTTMSKSGRPGDDAANLFIRGVSSWVNNDPLVLVDGVERPFNDIDPNEIENLSILKDASATAVFGTRGANGVILITTRRGTEGKVKVSGTAEVAFKQPINMKTPMDSYRTGLVMNEANMNDNNWGGVLSDEVLAHYRDQDLPYLYPSTNWQDIYLRDFGVSQRYNVNVSGGTEYARVFASLSYMNDGDIIKTEKQPEYDPTYRYNRYNYRVNIDMNVTKSTLLSLDAGGYAGTRNQPFDNNDQRTWRSLATLGPMVIPAVYGPDALELYPDYARPEEMGERLASTGITNANNPGLAFNHSGQRTWKTVNLNTSIKLTQKLDFITKGLQVKGSFNYMNTVSNLRTYKDNSITYRLSPEGTTWYRYKGNDATIDGEQAGTPVIAELESLNSYRRRWYYEISMDYARTFGKHEVSGLVLAHRRKTQNTADFPSFEEGVVGRATYNFDRRYLAEVNLGYTGSEQFAPDKRYGLFPSYAVGWNLHNEKFMREHLEFISKFKVKYSYGEVGSDASTGRWLYTSSYIVGSTPASYYPGTNTTGGTKYNPINEENLANVNATWERAEKQDLGFETGFFNDRLGLNVNLYKEHRTQILLSRSSIPTWLGVNLKQQNVGETKTQGYEIELSWKDDINRNLNYWTRFLMAFSDNRILNYDDPMYEPSHRKTEGKRIWQVTGYRTTGLIQDADQQMGTIRYGAGIMGLGDSRWVDINADGVIDENDVVPIGYAQQYPLYTYTFIGGLRWKNLSLDFMLYAATHVSRRTGDAFAWPLHRLVNQAFEYQLDSWSPDNRDAKYPAYHFDANRGHNNLADGAARENYNVYDSSYLRLKNLNLTYNFPKALCSKVGVDRLALSLQGYNLFTWCPGYPAADPEGSENFGTLTNGFYPQLRRFTLNAKVTF